MKRAFLSYVWCWLSCIPAGCLYTAYGIWAEKPHKVTVFVLLFVPTLMINILWNPYQERPR